MEQQPDGLRARSIRNTERTMSTNESKNPADREVASSSKVLDYLLFKHGAELGIVGWLTVIFAILNYVWAVKGLSTNSTTAAMALTQSALANQINFLKMCLDYPQLGVQNSSLKGFQLLFRQVPCEAFLHKLDFDAMSRVLVDPSMVPDVKLPSIPRDLGRPQPIYKETSFFNLVKELFIVLFWTVSQFMAAVVIVLGTLMLVGSSHPYLWIRTKVLAKDARVAAKVTAETKTRIG